MFLDHRSLSKSTLSLRWGVLVLLVLAASLTVDISSVNGQAYCALRDPTKKIYEYFPSATSYRSLVRTVDEGARKYVLSRLPFTIHFNELGRHTLYLPVENDKPIGLVHARSEAGKWGLTEIVWSLTPDLTVQDFSFQRCRSRERSVVETDQFKQQLVGKNFSQLRQLLDASGQQLVSGKLNVPAGGEQLAVQVVRSGLKTISVTEIVWQSELSVIQPLYRVNKAFPKTQRAQRVNQPYNDSVIRQFQTAFKSSNGKDTSSIDRNGVLMYKSIDGAGGEVGFLVKTPWQSMDTKLELWWAVRPDGVIKSVESTEGWPDTESEKAFTRVLGLASDNVKDCSTAAEIAGAEVLMLVRRQTQGE